ncbi:MAG TPA: hypothetical protein VNS52_12000, partial [Gemmatimonadaceae bacterium]|nr:hypothetical protein [Gemmatimonadaceae bacterium]
AVAAHRRESARAQLYRAALVSASTLAVAGAAVLIWSVTTRHRSDGDASAQSASPPAAMSDTTAEARLASRSAAPAPATSSRSEDPELAATPVVGDGSATPRERPSSREAARRASLAPPSSRYAVPSSGGGRVLPSRIHPDSAGAKSPAAPPAARPPERLPAVAANSTSAATSGAAPSSTAAPLATPAAPPVAVPRSPPPPTTVAIPPARNASVDIAAAVAAYARAIESRDIAAVRRAYPGMSDEQQRGFEQFFAAARALRVSFTVSGLDVSGPTAEANLVGAYDYVAEGKTEHQPVTFRAALRRDAEGTWRLMSVR